MKYTINDEKLSKNFSEGQIEACMVRQGFTRIEALIYLWSFNNFFTNTDEVSNDCGRPMYKNLSKTLVSLLEIVDD